MHFPTHEPQISSAIRDSHDGTGLSEAASLVPVAAEPDTGNTPTWHQAPVLQEGPLADRYHFLRLQAPSIARNTRPGQFVLLGAAAADESEPVLPRPMAVYATDVPSGTIDVVFGIVGRGTRYLAKFKTGDTMLVVGPLGRGFAIRRGTNRVLLVGRGIGTCSLTMVPASVRGKDVVTTALVSARHPASLIGSEEYRRAGVDRVIEVTDTEGTSDVERLLDALASELDPEPPQQILTCGSDRLARMCLSLANRWNSEVQVSLEAHMACGIGYCHGCSSGQRTASAENPLVCTQGPVFAFDTTVSLGT